MIVWGDKMKKILNLLICISLLLASSAGLSGCAETYSESDLKDAKSEGYEEGYKHGYYVGWESCWEKDCNELLIDARSIRNVQEDVYRKYGLTPRQAFYVIDEYEYDSTHGGYTWAEYKNAIDAIYFTAAIFPDE